MTGSVAAMTPLRIRLRDARKAKGLTQVQLAKRARVNQQDISRLEMGTTRTVNLAMLDRLAQALGVKATELLEDVPRKRKGK